MDNPNNRMSEESNFMDLSSSETDNDCSEKNTVLYKNRPPRNIGRNGFLRSVQEIPSNFRCVFEFPYFNVIQSHVFDDVLYTDKPVVVSAPTGSGKTVVFELAIIRLLMNFEDTNFSGDYKIVYVAPVKALCTERLHDWHTKFSKINLSSIVITGDTDIINYASLKKYKIIITTPEKWDSMTRNANDTYNVVNDVKLFMIDEVHLLKEESRGSVLEAIMCRLKILQKAEKIRFMAVSATILNIEDIAEWLGTKEEPAAFFKIDDDLRPVKLKKVVIGYPCHPGTSAFKFDITLNYKLQSVLMQYADGKPTLIFCSTRKGVEITSKHISQDVTFHLTPEQKHILNESAQTMLDSKMKEHLKHGVGCHHAGMTPDNRYTVETLFRNGHLPVLVTTSTLAMGVNLPAHLVIIKSTQHYADGSFQEYCQTSLVQMIGRAGRPQYDTTATVVIMTKLSEKTRYEKMLGGTELIESNLHRHLTEFLNAEVVLEIITDIAVALEWLRYTFLYIRVLKNPSHYGIPANFTKDKIEKKLQDLCQIEINALNRYGMLQIDQTDGFSVTFTSTGKLMANYYLAFDTMKLFTQIKGTESLSEILMIISKSKEYSEIHLRVSDKKTLNTLNRCKYQSTIRFPLPGCFKNAAMKVNCIIQATFGCLRIADPCLYQESARIMKIGERLSKCLCDFLLEKQNCFLALLNSLILSKCFKVKLWENSPYVARQLDKIGIVLASMLVKAGKTTFKSLLNANPRDIERIINRHPPMGNDIQDTILRLPFYRIDLKPPENEESFQMQVVVTLLNPEQANIECTAGISSFMTLLIGDTENNILLCRKLLHSSMIVNHVFSHYIDVIADKNHEIIAHLISENWVGIDCTEKVEIIVQKENLTETNLPSCSNKVNGTQNSIKKIIPPTPKSQKLTKIDSYFKSTKNARKKSTPPPLPPPTKMTQRNDVNVRNITSYFNKYPEAKKDTKLGFLVPTSLQKSANNQDNSKNGTESKSSNSATNYLIDNNQTIEDSFKKNDKSCCKIAANPLNTSNSVQTVNKNNEIINQASAEQCNFSKNIQTVKRNSEMCTKTPVEQITNYKNNQNENIINLNGSKSIGEPVSVSGTSNMNQFVKKHPYCYNSHTFKSPKSINGASSNILHENCTVSKSQTELTTNNTTNLNKNINGNKSLVEPILINTNHNLNWRTEKIPIMESYKNTVSVEPRSSKIIDLESSHNFPNIIPDNNNLTTYKPLQNDLQMTDVQPTIYPYITIDDDDENDLENITFDVGDDVEKISGTDTGCLGKKSCDIFQLKNKTCDFNFRLSQQSSNSNSQDLILSKRESNISLPKNIISNIHCDKRKADYLLPSTALSYIQQTRCISQKSSVKKEPHIKPEGDISSLLNQFKYTSRKKIIRKSPEPNYLSILENFNNKCNTEPKIVDLADKEANLENDNVERNSPLSFCVTEFGEEFYSEPHNQIYCDIINENDCSEPGRTIIKDLNVVTNRNTEVDNFNKEINNVKSCEESNEMDEYRHYYSVNLKKPDFYDSFEKYVRDIADKMKKGAFVNKYYNFDIGIEEILLSAISEENSDTDDELIEDNFETRIPINQTQKDVNQTQNKTSILDLLSVAPVDYVQEVTRNHSEKRFDFDNKKCARNDLENFNNHDQNVTEIVDLTFDNDLALSQNFGEQTQNEYTLNLNYNFSQMNNSFSEIIRGSLNLPSEEDYNFQYSQISKCAQLNETDERLKLAAKYSNCQLSSQINNYETFDIYSQNINENILPNFVNEDVPCKRRKLSFPHSFASERKRKRLSQNTLTDNNNLLDDTFKNQSTLKNDWPTVKQHSVRNYSPGNNELLDYQLSQSQPSMNKPYLFSSSQSLMSQLVEKDVNSEDQNTSGTETHLSQKVIKKTSYSYCLANENTVQMSVTIFEKQENLNLVQNSLDFKDKQLVSSEKSDYNQPFTFRSDVNNSDLNKSPNDTIQNIENSETFLYKPFFRDRINHFNS